MKRLIKLITKLLFILTIILLGFMLFIKIIYPDFNEFRDLYLTHGLLEGFVPQGLDYLEDEDMIIYCGYMSNGKASRIYTANNGHTKHYELYLDEDTEFKGHTGGITVYNDYLYLANDDNTNHAVYIIPVEAVLSNDTHKIILDDSFVPLSRASSCFVYDDQLWVGEYHDDNKYPPTPSHIINDEFNSLIAAYDINDDGSLEDIPSRILATNDRLQGVDINSRGDIVLSKSKGFNPSNISFYSNVLNQPYDMLYNYDGYDIPLWFLDNEHLIDELTLPPMSEEIFYMEDDVICTYFESASLKYYYGFLTGGTHIYTYHLDNK